MSDSPRPALIPMSPNRAADNAHIEKGSNSHSGVFVLKSHGDFRPCNELRKRSLEDLKFSMMLNKDAIAITDLSNRFEFVNDAFEAMTGYRHDEIIGQTWNDLLPDLIETSPATISFTAPNIFKSQKRISVHAKKDGNTFVLSVSTRFFIDTNGEATHIVCEGTDISAAVAARQHLNELANFDSLTHLPSRRFVLDRLQQTLDYAKCTHNNFAIAIIDVDDFKRINDSFGHNAGDAVLQEVAKRIKDSLSADETVGRLSGDEFLIIMPDTENLSSAMNVVHKIHGAFSSKLLIRDSHIGMSVSIGIAMYPDHGADQKALLEYADAAMYRDKESRIVNRQSNRRSRKVRDSMKKPNRVIRINAAKCN